VVPTETLAPLSVEEIEDQLRRNATQIPEPGVVAQRLYRASGGFLMPFAAILKSDLKGDVTRSLDRFASADINPYDFGVPIMPNTRKALSALLAYLSPNEDVRISDLQSIETETGVDGSLFGDWLIAIGLAEPGTSVGRDENDCGGIRLNPILRHPSVLRELSAAG
jgi:hypothetical protein